MESNPKIHVEMNSLNPSLHGKNGVLASCVGQISFFPQSSGGAGDGPRVFPMDRGCSGRRVGAHLILCIVKSLVNTEVEEEEEKLM